jgi:competence protein ComEC
MPGMALAFLIGIAIVETRADLLGIERLIPLLIALAALIVLPRTRLVAILACGILWATWRAEVRLEERLDSALEGRDLTIAGQIVSIPERGARRVQFDFAPVAPPGEELPSVVRLSWYDAPRAPQAGERWQLEVRLRIVRGFANAGGFDYEGQSFREGIGASGYVRTSMENRLLGAAAWNRPVLRLRALIARRMHDVLGDSSATGVLTGLAVGATLGITHEQWRVFSATGTTHLIAISGLHVTMVAALAMLIARAVWRRWHRRPRLPCADLANLCGALAATAYSLLAGLSVPTQRTLAMLLVALAATWLRRAQPASHALALALFVVLLIDPHAALTPGFWLSFLAVGAILLTLAGAPRPWSRVREFLQLQGAVTVALVPATLVLFGSVSVIAPVANLLAIPLFSALLVPLTLAGVAFLGIVPPLGEWILRLAACVFDLAWPALELAARWPNALVHLPTPSLGLAVALGVGAVFAILPLPGRLRVLCVAVALPLAFPCASGPERGELEVDVLDVGQGLALVLRTEHHVLVYDTGPAFRSGRSAGDLAVVPFLHEKGVRRVDLMVVSHADSDHAGGAAALVAGIPVMALRVGGALRDIDVPATPCLRGEAWSWDGVRFEFVHPARDERWPANDGSCVLRAATPRHSILLTGDIEHAAELHLHALGQLAQADIVVVPHHGSRSSSTPELTRSLGASYAVVSAGYANRWGFPQAAVVERWCATGAALIATADWGGVSFRLPATGALPRPSAYRMTHRRYWHAPAARAGESLCAHGAVQDARYVAGGRMPRATQRALP